MNLSLTSGVPEMDEESKLSCFSGLTEIRFGASRTHRHVQHHVLPAVLVVCTEDDTCLEGKVGTRIKRLSRIYIFISKH
jgi:hypothetical protein